MQPGIAEQAAHYRTLLESVLGAPKFEALREKPTKYYDFWPLPGDKQKSFLGRGSFGAAYAVKGNARSESTDVCVVKEMQVAKIIGTILNIEGADQQLKREREIIHVAVELAVLLTASHKNPNLPYKDPITGEQKYRSNINSCKGLFPNTQHPFNGLYFDGATIYLVLEKCSLQLFDVPEATAEAALATQLYHCLASKALGDLLPSVPALAAEGVSAQAMCARFGLPYTTVLQSGDVGSCIKNRRRLPLGKALVMTKQLLEGLQNLHFKGIVHRDIKPQNLVFSEEWRAVPTLRDGVVECVRVTEKMHVQIIDFGLSKFFEQDVVLAPPPAPAMGEPAPENAPFELVVAAAGLSVPNTDEQKQRQPDQMPRTGSEMPASTTGTLAYAAPEMLNHIRVMRGTPWRVLRKALPKLDIHAAGCTLFHMLEGREPFECYVGPPEKRVQKPYEVIIAAIANGPTFTHTPDGPLRHLLRLMMHSDSTQQPTAEECLAHPIFAGVTDEYTFEVAVPPPTAADAAALQAGAATATAAAAAAAAAAAQAPPAPPPAAAVADDAAVQDPADGAVDVNRVMREQEGRGDEAGADCPAA